MSYYKPSLSTSTDKAKEYHWNVFHVDVHSPPEYRTLLGHVISFVGISLVSALDPSSLVRAVVHAHLGYYNMCQKNYQHRDISIGNVLMVEQGIKCEPFTIKNPNETQTEILEVCRQLGIFGQDAMAFVIDGDMAIDWRTYFGEKHDGSNSGTAEFMSKALLEPNDGVIHSPVDDYWSFYFTAQWACVFRQALLGEAEGDPTKLEYLRSLLAGGTARRALGTNSIVDEPLTRLTYGSFLTDIQPFLRAWNQAMKDLSWDWIKENRTEQFSLTFSGAMQTRVYYLF
ncbi:hypothetical protein BT96DRAFT_142343 [Gymnopus androsaceus JB14]|uniref:Fungal-type protein kinase domain-containing protein n=1 Tax=Gymnopus androsaceus JB14 TaxID=1447944 RepID=A0A6A4HC73_9AGAR|nr:hypothetical protein BT96DRAFT_142343 [Gymnopus androsaceus JB14]